LLFCVWGPYRHECKLSGLVSRIDNGGSDDDDEDAGDDDGGRCCCNLLMVDVS
jgi:hypothetical protein